MFPIRFGERLTAKRFHVFAFLWLIIFILYLPTAQAGFVSDSTGWFDSVQHDGFWAYINRSRFGVRSMYQLTQLNTWLLYQTLGTHHWPWHLLFVTLHALVCFLLYALCARLFGDAKLERPWLPALVGTLLFAISPYASEVVVWEASFHYPQALLLIFGSMLLAQMYQRRQSGWLPFWSAILFFLATFTHELFYLTPWLVLSLALFYRIGLNGDRAVFRKTVLCFFLPQMLLFALHLVSFKLVYGKGLPHLGAEMMQNKPGYYLVKPPWYFFHLFAFGRFFPHHYREAIYDVFRTPAGAVFFYGINAVTGIYIILRFRTLSMALKLAALCYLWLWMAVAMMSPLWFPELLLVVCDRYTYLMLAFQWMMVALLLYQLRQVRLRQMMVILLACANLFLLLRLNRYWRQSAQVIAAIQSSPAPQPGKVKLLLNSPACLKGIPMIGDSREGEFRLMHNLFFTPPIADTMIEVSSYNMESANDGAHVEVITDSTVKVTLNQWGTWWWHGAFGAASTENEWYRLDMVDGGHWYNVILKKDPAQYQLLYQTGKELKTVDMHHTGEQW